jgi:hypothetical protein
VETYINICNGYLFEEKLDLAARYCDEGLQISLKIIELLDIRIISYRLTDEEKEATLKQLHHILRLHL